MAPCTAEEVGEGEEVLDRCGRSPPIQQLLYKES